MSQPELLSIPFARDASGSTKNEIPDTPGGGAPSQQATWTQGFPAVTMQPLAVGGIPPQGQDFNGVLGALSEHTVYQNQGGQYRFDAAFAAKIGGYPKGAVLQNDGGTKAYISTIDNNTDNFNAGTGIGTSWLPYSGGNASEAERGLVRIATTAEAQALTDDTRAITPKKLGDAMNAHVLGMGQTWQNVTSNRSLDTNYTNTTGRTIYVTASTVEEAGVNVTAHGFVNGVRVASTTVSAPTSSGVAGISFPVPAGDIYRVEGGSNDTLYQWRELR